MINVELNKIKEFANFINTKGKLVGYEYKQLETTQDYFNKPPYCGIIKEDDKWIFMHQGFPAPGDRPFDWLYEKHYSTLEKLIETETFNIERKISIKNDTITCFKCKYNYIVDSSKVELGDKYETQCPKCGYITIRKKVK